MGIKTFLERRIRRRELKRAVEAGITSPQPQAGTGTSVLVSTAEEGVARVETISTSGTGGGGRTI